MPTDAAPVKGAVVELFGREAELAAMAGFLEGVRRSGDVRMVEGEPGVGESALLDACARLADEAGFRVFRASGSEFEADMLPLREEIPRLPPAPATR